MNDEFGAEVLAEKGIFTDAGEVGVRCLSRISHALRFSDPRALAADNDAVEHDRIAAQKLPQARRTSN